MKPELETLFEEISREALDAANDIECSLDEFEEGLAYIKAEISDALAIAREELAKKKASR